MMRPRVIDPELYLALSRAALEPRWRWLYLGVCLAADRAGRLRDDPGWLARQLEAEADLITAGLEALVATGAIRRYVVEGEAYLAITTWASWVRPSRDEPPSLLPAPPGARGRPGARPPVVMRSALEAEFARFWRAYPRRVAKAAAWQVWLRLRPDATLTDRMIAAIEQQRQTRAWREAGGRYIPHPRTWLAQRRWEDDLGTGPRDTLEQLAAQLDQEDRDDRHGVHPTVSSPRAAVRAPVRHGGGSG